MPLSPGPLAAPAPVMGWSKFDRSGACPRSAKDKISNTLRLEKLSMHSCEGDEQARSTAEAVAGRSYGKLVAFLSARTGDVAAAEDALSEAFASALADWPRKGSPANPEAWLLTVARRKQIDLARRQHSSDVLDEDLEGIAAAVWAVDWGIPDRRLA